MLKDYKRTILKEYTKGVLLARRNVGRVGRAKCLRSHVVSGEILSSSRMELREFLESSAAPLS